MFRNIIQRFLAIFINKKYFYKLKNKFEWCNSCKSKNLCLLDEYCYKKHK